jgi:hypothetical protein
VRRLSVLFLFSLLAYPQSIPVLSQSQIQQLEITVAQNPASQSQALLGQNYALVILGITALGQYNVVTNVDPGLAQSTFAQHARYALQTSISPGVPGEGGEALWNLSFQLQGYLAQHPTAGMTYLDARELGVQVLDIAVTLEPANPTWRYYRIPILDNRSNFNSLPLTAGDAFMQAKEDISYLTGAIRNALLPTLAKLAVRAAARRCREVCSGNTPAPPNSTLSGRIWRWPKTS